ncbi:transcription termination factor NusA [Chloroflexota bacterium]
MKNEFVLAVNEIIDVRALPREVILDALRIALISAYRRDVSVSSSQQVDAEVDMATGTVTLLVEKETVESVQDTRTEVKLSEARQVDPDVELGDTLLVPIEDMTGKFGRIAAQTAKQVILQKIREAERESLYEEYVEREGDLISGTVQSITQQGVTISLGRAEALLPRTHMMPSERYRPHDKVRTYLLEVKKGNRGPQIIVSRSHRNMLRRLLEYEVPEIYNGQVEIKNIAREAGYRSKVAVAALQEGVDPVGACVGMRGIRIQNIVRELNEEKIDVIEWNQDSAVFITKALSPARVTGVFLDEYADSGRGGMGTATVIVPDDQLSLAIGREGQNARLAAKLTGWRIDIKSVTESAANAVVETENPLLVAVREKNTDVAEEVQRIMAKREAGRPIMPEEFQTIAQYARLAEQALLEERRAVNKKHQEYLDTIRETLPEQAFEMDISELDLPSNYNRLLGSRFESVGDVMLYLIVDEERVERALRRLQQDDALERVKWAIEELIIPDPVEEEPVAEEPDELEEAEVEEPVAVEEEQIAEVSEPESVLADDEVLPAVVEPELEDEVTPPVAVPETAPVVAAPAPRFYEDDEFPEVSDEKKKQKAKSLRRQLVFDEDAGQVVAKRKRKDSRKRTSYLDEADILDEDF